MVERIHYTELKDTIIIKRDGIKSLKPYKSFKSTSSTKYQQNIKSYKENERFCENHQSQNYGIGILLRDVICIDLDVGHKHGQNGIKTFTDWAKSKGIEKDVNRHLNETLVMNTPRNGKHILFYLPNHHETYGFKHNREVIKDVDLLCGYNNFEPSPNTQRSDGKYEIITKSKDEKDIGYIREAPYWAIELFKETKQKENKKFEQSKPMTKGKDFEYSNTPLNRILHALMYGFEKGSRNTEMTSLVGTMAWYVVNGKIDEEMAMKVMDSVAERCNPPMTEEECDRIWNSIVDKINEETE